MIKWQRLTTGLSIMAQSGVTEVGTGWLPEGGGSRPGVEEQVASCFFVRGCTIGANPSEATASGSALLTPLFWSQNFL